MQYDDSLVWSCPYKQAETPKTIQFTLKADQDFFYYFWQKKKKSLYLFSASCLYSTRTCYYINLVKKLLTNLPVRNTK